MRLKLIFALLTTNYLLLTTLNAEAPMEVRLGLKEIFGGAPASRAKLGLVAGPKDRAEAQEILSVVRQDLSLIGTVDLIELTPDDAKVFAEPRLETEIAVTNKGVRANAKIIAGEESLLSANFTESGNLRRLGHLIARDSLRALTGEPGFFLSRIAFVLKLKGNKKEIWIADWDGKNAEPLIQWATVSFLPAFNQDGKKLVFTSFKDGNPDLYLMDMAAKAVSTLSSRQGLNSSAAFDPKGEGLALTLSMGKDPNIYMVGFDGKVRNRLTRTNGVDTAPIFSPNGQEIAYTTDKSGNPQVFIMSRDGSNARRLTYGFFWADGADWSRDGTAIAFEGKKARAEKFQIFASDPLGYRFAQITTEGANEHPAFSPDSRFIAYSSNRNGRWEIFINGVAAETPPMRVISFHNGDALEPAWSASE